MKVRRAQAEDREQFLAWERRNEPRNRWSENFLKYPLGAVSVAENGRPLVYMPMHPVLMLDSLGPNPDIKARELRDALKNLLDAAEKCAIVAGMAEVVFWSSDEQIGKGAELLGFEKMDMPMYRKVLV